MTRSINLKPWRIEEDGPFPDIYDSNGHVVAFSVHADLAYHIVRAVNAYDETATMVDAPIAKQQEAKQ